MKNTNFFNQVGFNESDSLVLVASTGGHLAQLFRFAETLNISANSVWVTFRTPQSESLLAGKNVIYVPYIAPRDLKGVFGAVREMREQLNPRDHDGVLSTGAALAIAGFLWAKRYRKRSVYVESVSRTDGPSLTGVITSKMRLAKTFTQHEHWASARWHAVPSVLQVYRKSPADRPSGDSSLRVFVTLGTIQPYRFDALVDQVLRITTEQDEIVWQLGETTRENLPGVGHGMMTSKEFLDEAIRADVVITHAGVGTILQLLDKGISPVVVPRRVIRSEHVDDHQLQIWNLLKQSGIAVPCEVGELSRSHMHEAANTRTQY